MSLHDFNWIGLLWTLWCFYTLILCILRYRSTRQGQRAANTPGTREMAAALVAGARSRVYRVAVFVLLGVRSMTVPPSRQPGDGVIAVLVGLAFISLAIIEQRDVEREARVKRRLLQMSVESEGE